MTSSSFSSTRLSVQSSPPSPHTFYYSTTTKRLPRSSPTESQSPHSPSQSSITSSSRRVNNSTSHISKQQTSSRRSCRCLYSDASFLVKAAVITLSLTSSTLLVIWSSLWLFTLTNHSHQIHTVQTSFNHLELPATLFTYNLSTPRLRVSTPKNNNLLVSTSIIFSSPLLSSNSSFGKVTLPSYRSSPWSALVSKKKNSSFGPSPHFIAALVAAHAANHVSINNHSHFGGLEMNTSSMGLSRVISTRDTDLYNLERLRFLEGLDEATDEHEYDDPKRYDHYDEASYPQRCVRHKWSFEHRPTCQSFHESLTLERPLSSMQTSLQDWHYSSLGSGHYRDSWMLQKKRGAHGNHERVVLKSLRLSDSRHFSAFDMQHVHIEAMAMLKTSHSKRTFDIYGHCGTSVLVQAGTPIDKAMLPLETLYDPQQLAMMQKKDVYPMNILTAEQKLYIALAMAEGLAELHGHTEGVIVNDDVQVTQFLVAADEHGRLNVRLNDFNNARVLKWQDTEPQHYCAFRVKFDFVNRPPEELYGSWVDETTDVFALGNVFYTLLTGRLVFSEYPTWTEATEAIKNGTTPYLDDRWRHRSLIEQRLVESMEPCWKYDPWDRTSMFDIVKHLRETVRLYEAETNKTVDESTLLKELLAKDQKEYYERYNRYDRSTGAY